MGHATDSESDTSIAGILLAAGASRRLGTAKQLLLVDGTPMVAYAVGQALAHCDAGLVVVTGAAAGPVANVLADLPIRIVHNPAWESGMGASLRCGVEAAAPSADGLLIMLCDQPAVATDELGILVSAWRNAPERIVAAGYSGMCGVPAIFPACYRSRLAALDGERGARAIIDAAEDVIVVPMPSAAHDIDTPEDARWLDRSAAARFDE